jgi:hypothetical protein
LHRGAYRLKARAQIFTTSNRIKPQPPKRCCVCQWLHRSATEEGLAAAATTGASAAMRAAAASQRHELLEAILPESAAGMAGLLLAHAAGGAGARFAATQLAVVAAACLVGCRRRSLFRVYPLVRCSGVVAAPLINQLQPTESDR